MSVFRVKLNNTKQGTMDSNSTSIQRTIFVAGPKRAYRELNDGETFTDSNYWKRFTAAVVGDEQAFIEVVTDDGSVYSDVASENTFSVGETRTLTTAFTGTVVDFVGTHGGPALFLSVQNLDAAIVVTGELNGNVNMTFALAGGETMMFNQGDIVITRLRLRSASGTPNASYIASIKSPSLS